MMTMPDTAAALFDLLLFGHDTVECAYYLHPVAGPGIDFEALAEKKEAFRLAKTKDPMLVNLGGMDFLLQGYGVHTGSAKTDAGLVQGPGFHRGGGVRRGGRIGNR